MVPVALCGCAADCTYKGLHYQTIKATSTRNSEAAAKYNRQGATALSKGKSEKAEKLFKKSLLKDVDFGPAHNNLGRIYFDQGKNYLAAWEFEYATTMMPGRSEPYNNLGMVMERVGKMEQAIEAYETANALRPNHPEIVGNLTRAWWTHDQKNERTRELMEQLVFIDTRPTWVAWAKEQLACGKLSANDIVPVSPLTGRFESTPTTPPATYPVPKLAPTVPDLFPYLP